MIERRNTVKYARPHSTFSWYRRLDLHPRTKFVMLVMTFSRTLVKSEYILQ